MPRWLPRVLARVHYLAARQRVRLTMKDVFAPRVGETTVYLKLVLRTDCIVISFHEEMGHEDADAG